MNGQISMKLALVIHDPQRIILKVFGDLFNTTIRNKSSVCTRVEEYQNLKDSH